MKIFKKLLSIFMVMQCIASCSLIGHAVDIVSALGNPAFQTRSESDSSALSQKNQVSKVLEENDTKDTTASASCTEIGGGA